MLSLGLSSSDKLSWRNVDAARFHRGKEIVAVAAMVGCVVASGWVLEVDARPSAPPTVAVETLPPEAQSTYRLVYQGGPFAYAKDGIVFGNRERQLPPKPRGYYREYTVKTPRAVDRGARRIVCGGLPPTLPTACYYTDDHYASFRLIVK